MNIDAKIVASPSFKEGLGPRAVSIFDILMHVMALLVVLHVIYVVKLRYMEEEAVDKEVGDAIDTLIEEAPPLSRRTLGIFKAIANDDQSVQRKANSLSLFSNAMIIGGLAGSCIAIYSVLHLTCKTSGTVEMLRHTVVQNACLILLVGVIELAFVKFVVMHFSPVSKTFIAKVAKERILDNRKPIQGRSIKVATTVCTYAVSIAVIVLMLYRTKSLSHDLNYNRSLRDSLKGIDFTNILWQASAICIAVNAIFFTFGAKVEKDMLRTAVQRIVDDNTKPMAQILEEVAPDETKKIMGEVQSRLRAPKESEELEDSVDNQTAYVRALILVVAIVGVCSAASLIKLGRGQEVHWGELGRNAVIAACSSFLAEFTFLNVVVSNYDILTGHKVKNIIVAKLESKLNDNKTANNSVKPSSSSRGTK